MQDKIDFWPDLHFLSPYSLGPFARPLLVRKVLLPDSKPDPSPEGLDLLLQQGSLEMVSKQKLGKPLGCMCGELNEIRFPKRKWLDLQKQI